MLIYNLFIPNTMQDTRKYEKPQLIDLRIRKEGRGVLTCTNGSSDDIGCSSGAMH